MKKSSIASALIASLLAACNASGEPSSPTQWAKLVKVEGQAEPVPEQWLQDEEARVAHGLQLPATVPKPVPFDFTAAMWKDVLPWTPTLTLQYFNHLCATEAGQWIFRTERNVEGLYFARPQGRPTREMMNTALGPEMPWLQRISMLTSDTAHDQGVRFIQPPLYNYRYVEQPRRDVPWQAGITEPYVRVFGYTRQPAFDQDGKLTVHFKDKTPMQVTGIPQPTARYGYTWRGVKRPRDREFGIAGGEVLIYELRTREVLAVRRQFLIHSKYPRDDGSANWELAARCPQVPAYHDGGEFTQLAFDVLQTIEPSRTGRR